MELSPNQFTRPMSHIHDSFWQKLDKQLLADEVELAREKEWLSERSEADLTDVDVYLHSLPIEEHEAAIEGLRALQAQIKEQPIDLGWHRFTE